MSNVTFKSPVMARDVTAYAVAGDRGTILAVAKAHKVPIPFDCQDGEMLDSRRVKVTHVAPDKKCAIALTEKEKELLRQIGKITSQEIQDAEVNDMPPRYRLACQCFIRDEDIVVSFEGDPTAPNRAKQSSVEANHLNITSVDELLGYTLKIEEDAATHFEQMSIAMEKSANHDIARLFTQLSEVSRLLLTQTRTRSSTVVAKPVPAAYVWPEYVTPASTAAWAGDPTLARQDALRAALQGEQRGYDFYFSVASSSSNPDVVAAAKEFVLEEARHVEVLKAWITKEQWQLRTQPK